MTRIAAGGAVAALVVALGLAGAPPAAAQDAGEDAAPIADGYALAVDETGALRVPDVDYRAEWVALGSWITAGGDEVDGETGAAGLHVVYTQPGVVEHYRRTKSFPDGAVLVKELLGAKTETMTTGVISHATELEGWFVMVKDAEGRFADNALWGDGWGWAYFDADAPSASPTEDYALECKTCHIPAQETDWIYVYGYPALQAAKP